MTSRPPHIIDVKRAFGEQIRGYVVARNSPLIVVREFDGFAPAGFIALPASTVVDLVINEAWTAMIASEGHAELASIAPWFSNHGVRLALTSIHRRNINIKLECENCPGAEESGLHIGRVVALGDSTLDFVFFDSAGRWFETPYAIPYASITQIVVDDPYVTTFSRYVGPCPYTTGDGG